MIDCEGDNVREVMVFTIYLQDISAVDLEQLCRESLKLESASCNLFLIL